MLVSGMTHLYLKSDLNYRLADKVANVLSSKEVSTALLKALGVMGACYLIGYSVNSIFSKKNQN